MRLYLHLPSQRDLLIRCNSDPVGRCGPGQQHGRPLPLLPHNGQLLIDLPLFPREGVATTAMDTGSGIHHPRLQRSAGVSVGGSVGFCDVPRDTIFQRILQVGSARVQTCSRDTSGVDGVIETETEGSYSAASSQLSRDEDGDGGAPSLPPSTQPITGQS